MAKKKKGARPGGSKGARKAAASRGTRKAAAKAKASKPMHPGLKQANKVDLTFLKDDIRNHVNRLKSMEQTEPVRRTLDVLEQTSVALTSGCSPTMVIP